MRVLSARPAGGTLRRTKVAENGAVRSAARTSGFSPLMRTSRPDMKRVSLKNSPCEVPRETSPSRPEMQKADPWTRVTTPSGASIGSSPPTFQGSAMWRAA
jgi:hypothetical protein